MTFSSFYLVLSPLSIGILEAKAESFRTGETSGGDVQPVVCRCSLIKSSESMTRKLTERGFEVLLETSGALPVAAVPEAVCRIIDYKLPSSGMNDRMLPENFRHLRPHDEVKFVIGDAADYDCAAAAVRTFDLATQTPHILYSPVWGGRPCQELAERIIADHLPGRMQIQLHKIIWGPERTGV